LSVFAKACPGSISPQQTNKRPVVAFWQLLGWPDATTVASAGLYRHNLALVFYAQE
jgi:hypothetical protein